ncbi:hypothetical protein XENTR_v10022492 [Xenopus tropicalis]|nr:hypothetical protein XENTR_v10022492 [Xenopus tropicalis]
MLSFDGWSGKTCKSTKSIVNHMNNSHMSRFKPETPICIHHFYSEFSYHSPRRYVCIFCLFVVFKHGIIFIKTMVSTFAW